MIIQSRKQPFSVQKRQSAFAEIRSLWRKKPLSVRYSSPLAFSFGGQRSFCPLPKNVRPSFFSNGSHTTSRFHGRCAALCNGQKMNALRYFNISPKGAVNFLQQPRNIATG